VIGSMIGGIVGGVTSLALIAHNRQFYIQEGSPMTMSLPQPLTLAREQIDDANHKAAEQPAQIPATRSRPLAVGQTTGSGTCYTPGTPGTPDVVIPGTPAIGNSPGTPPTVIPGTPPTPPMPHPCP
jgi:hypothetical protein